MDVKQIPGTLPRAITVSRDVVAFCLAEDLETYGAAGPAACAWRWALTGEGPTPISVREWHRGSPDRDTMLDESRWPYGDGWGERAEWAEIQRARFLLWWLTAKPGEEVPARFRRRERASGPAAVEHGSTTVSISGVYGSGARGRSAEGL
jgi:hypothetical protein